MSNRLGRLVLALAIAVAFASPASADIIITNAWVGGAPDGVTRDNLDAVPLGSGGWTNPLSDFALTFGPDGKAVQGAVSGQYAPPYLSGDNGDGFGLNGADQPLGADATTYLTTGSTSGVGGANVTMTFGEDQRYFGLLWGSVDTYNTLRFYDDDTLIRSFTGANIIPGATGDQGVNGTVYVNFIATGNTVFDKVVATSSNYAFEFDNLAFHTEVVPEPASMFLLGSGLIGLAGAVRRRTRK